MVLTNCQRCNYLDPNPNHSSDILCSCNPVHVSVWQRLKSLDEYTLSQLKFECREFELNPKYEEKELTLSLSYQEWQSESVRGSLPHQIQSQLWQKTIALTIALPLQQWCNLATSSTNDQIIEQLSQQGIEAETNRNGDWIDVDSSCIEAIAFDESTSTSQNSL